MEWTDKHSNRAQAQGWDLFHNIDHVTRNPDGQLRLEKMDEMDTFDTDDAAMLHVVTEAEKGDPLCAGALIALARYNTNTEPKGTP